ncbi:MULTISPECIES: efflux RND transporter periplasmic adaptor subunit [Sphingomonadaceae]|uniref:RND family efflux transporter MFP subunit n=1 Tax=Novosphingobium resinovorum TaxID=158500 RepID=A0A031K0J9_9SPHN|nr:MULTISPECIES: efflux RND transporter periplasmic adaptor subunit [Sphingomonadaceae]EJU10229.1 RND family efflux transporter MFP subunit [Sphingomonas sp. LH128]EZP82714.1 RND family efflux transporter MFP subunit [Novosphingobium resinovorum]MBF7014640.1 efflux RND transporter periplasmic adaptor subunit [Novosphingobium sp. HR1a]WJM24879.1 efflux RND transporter periplasmic adaptor subunit [Novosphingobium resinovorum]GLK44638.1 MexE family multidrug efflux RND transporter periplasmic ada
MTVATKLEIPSEYASGEQTTEQRTGSRRAQIAIGALALVAVAGLGWKFIGGTEPAAALPPPALVQVAHPLVKDVTEWDDYVGRFAPSKTVEVRPRVSGAITQVLFRDGDYVQAGQALFVVDPRPYAASLAEARADAASASATLALARSDYARVAGLTGDEAMAASEVDNLRSRVRAAEAALAAAQARVRSRSLDVEFATVRAPISGRVSDRRVDAGNLVSGDAGANATLLTTINAVSPIYFTFDASESLFLKAQRDKAKGATSDVEVRLQDEAAYRWKGKLDFTDNGLNPSSGTIRIRASLDNKDGFLTPGMFGNMRLANGGTVKATLVPDAAVRSDQTRKVVMVVGKDGTVAAKPVEVGPLVDDLRVIRSGLDAGDSVIVSNYQAAIPGTKVTTKVGRIERGKVESAPAPAEPAAAQATFN